MAEVKRSRTRIASTTVSQRSVVEKRMLFFSSQIAALQIFLVLMWAEVMMGPLMSGLKMRRLAVV